MSCDLDVGAISEADLAEIPAVVTGAVNITDRVYTCTAQLRKRPEVTYKMSPVSSRAEWYWLWRGLSEYRNNAAPNVAFGKGGMAEEELEVSSPTEDLHQTGSSEDDQWADDWADWQANSC